MIPVPALLCPLEQGRPALPAVDKTAHLVSPGTPVENCSLALFSPPPRPAPLTTSRCPCKNQTGSLRPARPSRGQGESRSRERFSFHRGRRASGRAGLFSKGSGVARAGEAQGSYQALWWKTRAGSLRNRFPNCGLFQSSVSGTPSGKEAAMTPDTETPSFP